MHTVHRDGVAGIKRRRRDLSGDGVRNIATASGRDRLKEDLESSTWQRHQDFKASRLGDFPICGSQLQLLITKTKVHKSSLEPREIIIINLIRTQSIVILFSIHNDEWKSFQSQPQTALRSYALSWKPCQGDSLNLPDHGYKCQCCSPIQAKSDSLTHAHTQAFKREIVSLDEEEEFTSFQDKYEHVGQEHKLIKKVKSR
ncbi:hypothetical protein Tco_1319320 [Tanacetum coccineum]